MGSLGSSRVLVAALWSAAAFAFTASQAIAAPVNVALNQPVSASSQWSDACAAAKANNGSDDVSDTCGGWSPSSADVQPWLQIDLGSAKQISALELVTRQNCCDAPETRQNFEIRASNDPSFATYVVLGSQGATALPFKATWTKTVTDTNSYRYIRATKTGYFFIAELRVLVETSPPPSNIALNRPASASSQWADTCAAAKANNGSTDAADSCGGWSPTSADAQPWWQVDLGSAYRITTLELVTRQNCCDQPETRQNFEIRASNSPSFTTYVVLGSQGATALPFKATWTKTVTDTNSYRYIRATKPGYFFIAELRVFGNAATNQAPTVFLTSPANNASFIAPANIALSATAGDPDGSIARVEFYNGTTLIATDNNGADGWAINWNAVPQGSYALSAKAFDNANASGTSAPANVTVTSTAPNLALSRPASASSQWSDACPAAKANNGSTDVSDSCGGWSPSSTDGQPWLQIDLGSPKRISALELVTRQNCCDQPETRQNFQIRASNDPSFATYVVLGSQGATALPFKATWTKAVTDPTGYRYIRATKAGYFFIAELKVFGANAVNQPPIVSLTSPANNASFTAPANITLSATASDADGSVAKVEFYRGTALIATDSNASDGWSIIWSAVPQGSYAISAKAIDNSGTATVSNVSNITVAPANSVSVVIASPQDNAVIADDTVLVKGTFSGPSNTGITINGVIASTAGTTFAVEVPLQLGANILTVTATAPDGAKITKTMTVTSSGVAPINTTASPSTGIAPLQVSFSTINPAGKTIQRIDVDFDNNGTIDATSLDPRAAITHTFDSPGIYPVKFTVSHSEGTESQTVLVSVLDSGQMDQTFRAIWDGMNSALVAKNKVQALRYLNSQAQAKYGPLIDTLMPYFPTMVASYSTLQRLSLSGNVGEYAVNRMVGGQNRIFLIYFVLDTDGVWRLDSM